MHRAQADSPFDPSRLLKPIGEILFAQVSPGPQVEARVISLVRCSMSRNSQEHVSIILSIQGEERSMEDLVEDGFFEGNLRYSFYYSILYYYIITGRFRPV